MSLGCSPMVWDNLNQTFNHTPIEVGKVTSNYDQAIFTWYFESKLLGIIAAHVDDFYFSGSAITQTKIMNRLHHVFTFKYEEDAEFHYIEQDIKKNVENIKFGLN